MGCLVWRCSPRPMGKLNEPGKSIPFVSVTCALSGASIRAVQVQNSFSLVPMAPHRGLGASCMEHPAMASGAGIALAINRVGLNKNKDLWFFGSLRSGGLALRRSRAPTFVYRCDQARRFSNAAYSMRRSGDTCFGVVAIAVGIGANTRPSDALTDLLVGRIIPRSPYEPETNARGIRHRCLAPPSRGSPG